MAPTDDADSVEPPCNKLVLQFSAGRDELAASFFQDGEVSYEGDDTYRFEANTRGEPLTVTFLSRSAMAEFLEWMVVADGHKVKIATKCGGFSLSHFTDVRYDALMRYLLVLRDSRLARLR